MSHFPVLVLVEEDVDRERAADAVTPLLAAYDENGEWFREDSRWDWWVVGGRWTGAIAPSGYDPFTDPANQERCFLCDGTGDRPGWVTYGPGEDGARIFADDWAEKCNGCNGCHGKGNRLAFQFQECDEDVVPVSRLAPKTYDLEDGSQVKFLPTAIVTPDGRWHERGRVGWLGELIDDEGGNEEKSRALWEAAVAAILEQHPAATAVLVDCHV